MCVRMCVWYSRSTLNIVAVADAAELCRSLCSICSQNANIYNILTLSVPICIAAVAAIAYNYTTANTLYVYRIAIIPVSCIHCGFIVNSMSPPAVSATLCNPKAQTVGLWARMRSPLEPSAAAATDTTATTATTGAAAVVYIYTTHQYYTTSFCLLCIIFWVPYSERAILIRLTIGNISSPFATPLIGGRRHRHHRHRHCRRYSRNIRSVSLSLRWWCAFSLLLYFFACFYRDGF